MVKKVSVHNYIGCLLGGAVGDALGAPVEFMTIEQMRAHYGQQGVTGYVEHPNNVGEFTDDTQMTLFTAEGLLRSAHRVADRGIWGAWPIIAHHSYLRWLHTQNIPVNENMLHEGIYDVEQGWLVNRQELHKQRAPGDTCISALRSGVAGSVEAPINNSKGCGTVMRSAPVGLMCFGDHERAFDVARRLSALTHGHPNAGLSAGFFASMISDLAIGGPLADSIQNAIALLKTFESHEETLGAVEKALDLFEQANSVNRQPTPETVESLGHGWVAEEALAIALFCSLYCKDSFADGVLLAVNHSGDSDSTGSIVGNILGLMHGAQGIPALWVSNLKFSDIVRQVGEDLHVIVKGSTGENEWRKKYPPF